MTSTSSGFRRALRPPLLAAFGVAAVLTLTACGSEGGSGAGGGSGSTQAAGEKGTLDDHLLNFAKCMRGKGVDVRDPKPGDPGVLIKNPKENPDKAKKAWHECGKHLPAGYGDRTNDPKYKDQALKFAQCMRANGADVPDPGPDGDLRIENPESPEFKRAEEKCKQYRPNGWGG